MKIKYLIKEMRGAIAICVLSFLFISSSYAQSSWTIVTEQSGVTISKRMMPYNDSYNGIDAEYYELKFENTTNNAVILDWKFDLYIDGICSNCNSLTGESDRTLTLDALQVFISDCSSPADRAYVLFKKLLNSSAGELTDFTFSNLTISS